mgnify:FL=1
MGDGMKKKRACFVGNPNVGKSSLFNFLTHKNEHTGNWTGKTVKNAYATFSYKDTLWEVVDLPGTYSLIGESKEEKIASSFVCSLDYDLAVVVLDASNLERSIVLLLEVLDVTDRVIVCLNLMDEAKAQKIDIDLIKLQKRLNIPIVITKASEGIGCARLCDEMNHFKANSNIFKVVHEGKINNYLELSKPYVSHPISYLYQEKNHENESFSKVLRFYKNYITREELLKSYIHSSDSLLDNIVKRDKQTLKKEDIFWNKVLSHKFFSYLIMSLIFFLILWLTIFVSNIPSDFMFSFFSNGENFLLSFFSFLPDFIVQPLILGGYRTFYWVISVMLPPLIIFFPLFSYLEDYGLFPRIAFNMDKPFKKCGSCGKQSLTMCMGLGCNAIGVTNTRIMEDKKMRILAILTNNFMPCNGRFPAMITMLSLFFIRDTSLFGSFLVALGLLLIIVLGIVLTFLWTKILNHFLFKKEEVMFILELPTFRRPSVWKTFSQALKEKAFPVLKRAMLVSFPLGILIYLLASWHLGNSTFLLLLVDKLNNFGHLFGLDGAIILAFILGMPANEIVIPSLLLCYTKSNALVSYTSMESLRHILVNNGWTWLTALCFLIIMLCHYPCTTTLLSIKKESKSWSYTFLAFLVPIVTGLFLTFIINFFLH